MILQRRSGAAFIAGLLIGITVFVGGNQRHVQAAGSGEIIATHVFCILDSFGSPTDIFDVHGCTSGGGHVAQCNDGIDNDADGLIDHPADPGCTSASDDSEPPDPPPLPACMDGIDNDHDGLIDYPADPGCSSVADNDESNAPAPGTENTLALCSDTVDNDSDGLVDLADPDCAAFKPKITLTKVVSGGVAQVANFSLFLDAMSITSGSATTTTVGTHVLSETASSTYPGTFSGACDSTGHVTVAIGDNKACTLTNTFTPGATSTPPTDMCPNIDGTQTSVPSGKVQDSNGNCVDAPSGGGNPTPSGGGSPTVVFGGGGGGNGPISTLVPDNGPGEVLGTTTVPTSCGPLLSTYLRKNKTNDPTEVRKLQNFLNTQMRTKLRVTGFFGALTDAAVRKFQLAYNTDVLAPWVAHGLPSATTATGYVFKTTQRMINNLYCTTLQLPVPQLP